MAFGQAMISRYDRIGDGVLDAEEGKRIRILEGRFEEIDTNENGQADQQELTDFFRNEVRRRSGGR